VNHIEFTEAEQYLLKLINGSLHSTFNETVTRDISSQTWEQILSMAEKHSVLPVLHNYLLKQKDIPDKVLQTVKAVATKTVLQQYRLLFLSKYIVELFKKHDVEVAVMKGVTVGAYYETPELRKSGDVDLLLLDPDKIGKVIEIMQEDGFKIKEEQLALHHVSFQSREGIDIEMHTLLAEPFDNEKTNNYLRYLLAECKEQVIRKEIMGLELPVLSCAYFAFELLLHMLQHFLRSGFGLKLLCDWVVFWKQNVSKQDKEKYLELVERAGIKGFSDMVTLSCIQYLGMDEKKVSWMNYTNIYSTKEFLKEIFEAEEFGKSNVNRMVVMRGTGISDYIREFHHQMCLNFPKGNKCVLIWPILWVITLYRFLRNNKTVRKISTREILAEAKRRSKLMEQLELFQ